MNRRPDPDAVSDETPALLEARAAALRAQASAGEAVDLDEFRRRSRRSVLLGGLGVAAGAMAWRWVQTQPEDDNIPTVLRGGLEFNEAIWTAYTDNGRTVPTYDVDDATPLIVNGLRGIDEDLDLATWTLRVEGPSGSLLDELTLDDIRALGEEDLVVNHKCIEGWSNITHWTGVPFARFAERYSTPARAQYVSFTTVDGGYYVGMDHSAAVHPQILLGTGLEGEPLTHRHGAPLRLVSPIHYGIKSIKQIGTIRFQHERPRDFWAERGYDWYSAH